MPEAGEANQCSSTVYLSQVIYCGGYSGDEPPLTIPNREVKLTSADGTAPPGGRVGRCRASKPRTTMSFGAFCACSGPLRGPLFLPPLLRSCPQGHAGFTTFRRVPVGRRIAPPFGTRLTAPRFARMQSPASSVLCCCFCNCLSTSHLLLCSGENAPKQKSKLLAINGLQ